MAGVMDLIRKMRNPETKLVLEAIAELRARGWLEDGSLRGVMLCHTHLEGSDLYKANLHEVDLHQAHLEGADLSLADLCGAKITRACLRGANLSQTNLSGADLFKADLTDARNVTDEQLAQAKRLSFATMPDGTPYNGRFNLAGDLDLARWGKVDPDDPAAMAYFLGVSLENYVRGQGKSELAPEIPA
ncbi:MAG TPA: pentapeptide repeat-containing protein [Anaerolineales bacterium]|nr:pentapeptide repeat-containing protein [Anaerolineales bacterium]